MRIAQFPFNPTTTIKYELAMSSKMSIKIYYISGRDGKEDIHNV